MSKGLLALCVAIFCSLNACSQTKGERCVTTRGPQNGNGTTTKTVCSDPEHVATVSSAARLMTSAGLTYFLVTRPNMQAERNERINAIEGQFAPVYESLDELDTIIVPVQLRPLSSLPAIKGYRLGETWQEFVDASPLLQKRIASCDAQKRPDTSKKRKRIDFNPCSDLWLMRDNFKFPLTMDCMETSWGASRNIACQDLDGQVVFRDGTLSSLKIVLSNYWAEVLPDVTAKLGPPNAEDEKKTLAIWNTESFHLAATQTDEGSAVSWITSARYREILERTAEAAKDHQNSLD